MPDSFQLYVPITVDVGKDRLVRLRLKVAGPVSTLELPLMSGEPKAVRLSDLEGVLAEVKTVDWKE